MFDYGFTKLCQNRYSIHIFILMTVLQLLSYQRRRQSVVWNNLVNPSLHVHDIAILGLTARNRILEIGRGCGCGIRSCLFISSWRLWLSLLSVSPGQEDDNGYQDEEDHHNGGHNSCYQCVVQLIWFIIIGGHQVVLFVEKLVQSLSLLGLFNLFDVEEELFAWTTNVVCW